MYQIGGCPFCTHYGQIFFFFLDRLSVYGYIFILFPDYVLLQGTGKEWKSLIQKVLIICSPTILAHIVIIICVCYVYLYIFNRLLITHIFITYYFFIQSTHLLGIFEIFFIDCIFCMTDCCKIKSTKEKDSNLMLKMSSY